MPARKARGAMGRCRGVSKSTMEDPQGLTSREREIVDLIAIGVTNTEIARALSLSVKTVRNHTVAIYRKLGARTRVEAAAAVWAEKRWMHRAETRHNDNGG